MPRFRRSNAGLPPMRSGLGQQQLLSLLFHLSFANGLDLEEELFYLRGQPLRGGLSRGGADRVPLRDA